MNNQITVNRDAINAICGEMFKIEALARTIPALFEAYGSTSYKDSDRFVDDDMVPLAQMIEEAAASCRRMADAMSIGRCDDEEPEEA